MEFLANYWVVLLVGFILILLILLAYLIDKKTKSINNEVKEDAVSDEKSIHSDNDILEEGKFDNISINQDSEIAEDDYDIDENSIDDNIDEEFEKVIPKKELIDTSFKESIDDIKIGPLKIENSDEESDEINKGKKIVLPDIKLKK